MHNADIPKTACLLITILMPICAWAGYTTIHNDTFWNTAEGKPIYSQGGGIFTFKDPRDGQEKYFWYGCHYEEADKYRAAPVGKYDTMNFRSISLYTSTDLLNWHEEADAMTRQSIWGETKRPGWVGRMGVCYVEKKQKYALFVQNNSGVLVCTADSPLGPFNYYRRINMKSRIGTDGTGDQTVFTDPDDGSSYLICSKGHGRNEAYVCKIGVETETDSIGLISCKQVYKGVSREGNCMFKHDGRYYLYASNIYGWDASLAYYLVADSIYGPYQPVNDMQITEGCEQDYAHVTQTGFFVNMRRDGRDLVIYCGDRWADFADNGLGFNQWMPMSFREDGLPVFNSLSSWQLNPLTAEWRVAPDNNYVMNGSFEADRRIIPLEKKPQQDFLTGWKTEVLRGTPVGNNIPNSPQLNAFNNVADHQWVTGKMSLYISDSVSFRRRISQEVTGTPVCEMPNGTYLLSAKVRTTGRFSRLYMFADNNHDLPVTATMPQNSDWQTVTLPVTVVNHKLTIGFEADGQNGTQAYIDDVKLEKILK